MFHRLHIQMTFFSALIIGIVIFIMTTACNFIAENSTGQNAWNTLTGFCRQKKIMIFPWISETTEILFI